MNTIRHTSLSILLMGSLALLGITGCARQQGTIRVGFIGPLTGTAASFGIAQKKGMDLALEEVNAAGGGRILRSDGTEASARDFRTQLAQVKAALPDFLYIPVHPDPAGPLLRQATELALGIPILVCSQQN